MFPPKIILSFTKMKPHNFSNFRNISIVIKRHLIKIRVSEARFAQDVALRALEDLPRRPDGLVAHWALDGAEDDGHLGGVGSGHLGPIK
jgi:hypothetical protein